MKQIRLMSLLLSLVWISLIIPPLLATSQQARKSEIKLYGNSRYGYSLHYDPRYGSSLPRLTHFPDPTVLRKVNEDLAREDRLKRQDADDCLRTMPNHMGYWEQRVRVVLFTPKILSIARDTFTVCGAYPETVYEPLTFNLQTGERFDFDRDAAKLFKDPTRVSENLLNLYRRHYKPISTDCDVSSMLDEVTSFTLYFDKKGLVEIPELPHVIAGCGPPITIPFPEIQDLVTSDNPFRTLFDQTP